MPRCAADRNDAPTMSTGVTTHDGIATMSITFRRFVSPGLYVLRFKHHLAPDVFSSAFEIVPPVKEIEILSNPAADTFYNPELVWHELEAATFKVTPGFSARKIPVQESPAAMKGSIIGEHVDDQGPVLRVKDHRGLRPQQPLSHYA